MQHQDWQTVVFNKKQEKIPVVQKKYAVVNNKPAWKIEKQVDDDSKKPLTYVSKADADYIIQTRIKIKKNQKQLAQELNLQLKDLQDIESCKAVENKALISKIKKHLLLQAQVLNIII